MCVFIASANSLDSLAVESLSPISAELFLLPHQYPLDRHPPEWPQHHHQIQILEPLLTRGPQKPES